MLSRLAGHWGKENGLSSYSAQLAHLDSAESILGARAALQFGGGLSFGQYPILLQGRINQSRSLRPILINEAHPFLLLACVLSLHAQKVILASGLKTTSIVIPFGASTGLDPYHNRIRPNFIGHGAKWVWSNREQENVPEGEIVIAQSIFQSECELGTLIITADNQFTATINSDRQYVGDNWTHIYRFHLNNLSKGRNVLRVKAANFQASPAGIIYAITQQCQPSHMMRKHE